MMKMLQSKKLLRTVLFLCYCVVISSSVDSTTLSPDRDEVGESLTTGVSTESPELTFGTETNNASNFEETSESFTSSSTVGVIPTTLPSLLLNSTRNVPHQISTTLQPKTNVSEVLQKWVDFENLTKIFMKEAIKKLLPGLIEGTSKMNISASCSRDVFKFLIGLQHAKTWAFSFIDASAKIIDGVLGGTMSNLGSFDQCIDIKVRNDRKGRNFGKVMFAGQYCALDLKPPLPSKPRYYKLNDVVDELREFASGDNVINEAAKAAQFFHFLVMRMGICVPSGCSASDIQQVIDPISKETHWNATVVRCEVKQENEYTPLIIGVMTAMCFFGFLLCVGSLIDLYYKYAQKKISNVFLETLVCFSFVSNFKRLVDTKSGSGNMSCLHGMRFLSISWIICGHTYLNVSYILPKGLKKAMEFQKDFFFQAVVNASVAVDTFFFIGGLLVCYVTVKVITETQKPFSIVLYIVHRLFRLLPVYIMIIAFIYLAPILGSGPVFHDVIPQFLNACYKNWWTNVLFVNNFINTNEICLPQSWYVACDMQLYIAALIVILPILRWPWLGLTIASLGIVASVAGTAAVTYINDYPPTMLFVHPDLEQRLAYWANAYFKPYSHAGPYCIGLIAGYILATQPKLKFSKLTRTVGWIVASISNSAVLYGVYEWNKGRDPELIETLFYSGLHRIAWTFGIAWVVINCATGQGGVVNYILSWKFWIPLGRLTYTIYLIHPIVQIAAVANARINVQISHYFVVWIFFGHLMITIGSAFAACMLVEAPFIGLEKIFLRALFGKPKSSINGHAPIPSGSTTPKSVNSEEDILREERTEPVSHL